MTGDAAARPDTARLVFYAGAAIALSHLANDWIEAPMPWGPAWKASGIVLLGVYALMSRAWLPALGFFLSAVGDVALEIPNMIAGMAAFGLAHVCYAAAFFAIIRRDGVMWKAWPLVVVLLAISIELAVLLWAGMNAAGLLGPALGYQMIISSMAVLALLSRAPMIAKVGALVFMLSDTILAFEIFNNAEVLPGSVWITYAAAQIMLAIGFTQKAGPAPQPA
jgi:uncharacterized membrane protein YhhN